MSASLNGRLGDFGIADVFQLVGHQRKTGVLDLVGAEDRRVQVAFVNGNVVSAAPFGVRAGEALGEMLVRCGRLTREQLRTLLVESESTARPAPQLAVGRGWIGGRELERIEDLLTRETLFEVLRWDTGEFNFHTRVVEHDRDPKTLLGAEQILMDCLRMVDEWQSFGDHVPSLDTVMRRTAGFEEYRSRSGASDAGLEAAQKLFALVDGRISVQRVADLSLLGTFDAVRILADLRRQGVVEPLAEDALSRLRARARPRLELGRAQIVRWFWGGVALSLLGSLGVVRIEPAASDPARVAIVRDARVELADAYAVQRLRHALEAFRFATGRWPGSLSELVREEILEEAALTASDGRPYYYEVRDGDAVILGPEG